jgi:P-type E1-E2 ATPase
MPKDKYPKGHLFDVKGPRDTGLGDKDFTFIGLISLIDPPRDSVPSAIALCKTAGIKVIMVTGD